MLVPIEDVETGKFIYVNPEQVAVVFENVNEAGTPITVVNLLNGNVATFEAITSVVNKLGVQNG